MKKVVVIGAGPAGLTAAVELVRRSNYEVTLFESNAHVGGISATIEHKGNCMDLGGHRFFSKSDRVLEWWFSILPLESTVGDSDYHQITYQNSSRAISNFLHSPSSGAENNKETPSGFFRIRKRFSRIYFSKYLLSYPLKLEFNIFKALGFRKSLQAAFDYAKRRAFPVRPEENLADFFTNRFGDTLYKSFFKEYTEKVWGEKCEALSASWGAQRIKDLSLLNVAMNALASFFRLGLNKNYKKQQTSLIEQFLYPTRGPGELWEVAAREFSNSGGRLHFQQEVIEIKQTAESYSVTTKGADGALTTTFCDILISSMPLKNLIQCQKQDIPAKIREIAHQLPYRDFLIAGLLYKNLSPSSSWQNTGAPLYLNDTWIYVQEPGMKVGRLQFFNNWSEHLVRDKQTAWVGLEYFANECDDFWKQPDRDIISFAAQEFEDLGFARKQDLIDGTVVRVPKAYPVYSGTYSQFEQLKEYLLTLPNLYSIGRNGMHRYNNQDHSMLTAMLTVDHILTGKPEKDQPWMINTEQIYHEERT